MKKELKRIKKANTSLQAKLEPTFSEYIGSDGIERLMQRFNELCKDKKGGFIYIHTNSDNKCTDAYYKVCDKEVSEVLSKMLVDATGMGLVSEHE